MTIYNKILITLLTVILLFGLISCNKTIEDPIIPDNYYEDFSGEYFKSFPDVLNIVYYMGMAKEDVMILSEEKQFLSFCFETDHSIDYHDTSIISYPGYIRMLEADGYELAIYDGTTRGAYKLTKDNIEIWIIIGDYYIDSYINDSGDEPGYNKITNQNTIFKIKAY